MMFAALLISAAPPLTVTSTGLRGLTGPASAPAVVPPGSGPLSIGRAIGAYDALGAAVDWGTARLDHPTTTFHWTFTGEPIVVPAGNILHVTMDDGTEILWAGYLDVTVDGFVNGQDYDYFMNGWWLGLPFADYSGDGFIDGMDYDLFMNLWEDGGPR